MIEDWKVKMPNEEPARSQACLPGGISKKLKPVTTNNFLIKFVSRALKREQDLMRD